MKKTNVGSLVLSVSLVGCLVCGPAMPLGAECHRACGAGRGGAKSVVRMAGGHAAEAALRRGVIAYVPSDGTPLLLRSKIGAHGTLYGRPYNYRNLLDYPWHAPVHGGAPAVVRVPLGEAFPAASR
ncbi:MAG: hypothetical protein GTO03_01195 [Planctomycetales bacterium]|nr:hypothetical protein [Planctomycetales bacterium]